MHVYNVCKHFVYFTLPLNEMIKCDIIDLYTGASQKIRIS